MRGPSGVWDKAGIFLSGLCAVHCVVTPLLLLFLPSLSNFFDSEYVHLILFAFVAGVGSYTFVVHYKYHRSKRILGFAFSGILLLGLGLIMHESLSRVGHAIVNLPGSILLIWAHWQSLKVCQCKHGKVC